MSSASSINLDAAGDMLFRGGFVEGIVQMSSADKPHSAQVRVTSGSATYTAGDILLDGGDSSLGLGGSLIQTGGDGYFGGRCITPGNLLYYFTVL